MYFYFTWYSLYCSDPMVIGDLQTKKLTSHGGDRETKTQNYSLSSKFEANKFQHVVYYHVELYAFT